MYSSHANWCFVEVVITGITVVYALIYKWGHSMSSRVYSIWVKLYLVIKIAKYKTPFMHVMVTYI